MKTAIAAALAAAVTGAPAPDFSTLNPAAIREIPPDQIDWKPAAGLTGTDSATVVGDPAKPGFYVVMNRFHPGNFSRPHYHANDRYIMVVSGTWWVSTGATFDPERNTVPIKAGTFVVHTGREVHYDGARAGGGDAVVMIFGQGPGTRIECTGPTAETGPGPCADARARTAAQGQLRVFVGGAMTGPLREVASEFTRRTGKTLDIVSDTTGSLQKRLRAGDKADVVVITAPAVDALTAEKLLVPADRTDLARGLIGVGVRKGAKAPDLSSADSFKAALVAAKSVSYVDPKAGGTSGAYFEGLMAKMGIADQMKAKTVYRGQGSEVAAAVAAGEAELGITFTSELAPNPGVAVAGPLPAAVQLPTVYTAAVTASTGNAAAAEALVDILKGTAGMAAVSKAGLEPLK